MKTYDPRTGKFVALLKIELGTTYIQVDPLNEHDLEFVKDFLTHTIENIRKMEQKKGKE